MHIFGVQFPHTNVQGVTTRCQLAKRGKKRHANSDF